MSDPAPQQPVRRPMRDLPLTRLLPNMLTMMSLCSGLTAIRFGLQDKWEQAVLAIALSAIFDVLDGRVARMLGIASKFGAELDSLADCVSFGVAPGLMMYLWAFQGDLTGFGWVACLIFAVCNAMRLARFNTMLDDHEVPAWTKSFFTGVPAPAGAGLGLMPLILVLAFGEGATLPMPILSGWLVLVGALMVSRLPTFAMKNRRIAPIWIVPIMLGVLFMISNLITNTWRTFFVLGFLYMLSIPCSYYSFERRQKADNAAKGAKA